jgi:hypothetical protein
MFDVVEGSILGDIANLEIASLRSSLMAFRYVN